MDSYTFNICALAFFKLFANRVLGEPIDNSEDAVRQRHKHLVESYKALQGEHRATIRNGMRLDKKGNIVKAKNANEQTHD